MTYTKVAAILVDKDPALRRQYENILTPLEHLHDLYKVLRKARDKRGAIDFDSTETRIVFGLDRKIERIIPLVRNDAHRLIEECMLLANVATAEYLAEHKIPILYRIHETPSLEKLTDLREFLVSFGLTLGGGEKPEPKHYGQLLEMVRPRTDSQLIETVLLRSLRQAMYTPDNVGHFGLAYPAYTHFTSPIRRYPDLLVHRAIRHLVQGKSAESFPYSHGAMVQLGDHCSQTERRADEATRDVVDWLKCEYMQDKLGEEYDGVISSVTSFGLFIALTQVYVEGLIHITGLPSDYYQFDSIHHRLVGERTGRIFRLGDPIRVTISRVNLDDRKIDFELAAKQPNEPVYDPSAIKKSDKKGNKPDRDERSKGDKKSNKGGKDRRDKKDKGKNVDKGDKKKKPGKAKRRR